ncbi:arsenic resistance protein [Candidatus Thorarchaeota archaeon]|nr:MAG: arsenic resistance protein [Candidatus Thorarchaeota archaeon]
MTNSSRREMNLADNKALSEEEIRTRVGLGLFEKYLPLWVAICMIIGIALSLTVPGISEVIDQLQIAGISIPIGICLFLMMYPAMLNVQAEELKKLGKNPKPIILTLVSNWIVAPLVGVALANIFLGSNQQLIVAIILLSSSPCTAMVLVWGYLANGNQEQNIINTSFNTVTIMILYAPIVALLTGISSIPIDRWLLVISVTVFIGAPLVFGVVSKRVLTDWRGVEWFNEKYKPTVGKIGLVALLVTLIVLFSLNGKVMMENPDLLILVSIPLLLGFLIVVVYNLLITRMAALAYQEGVITVIIGSSSHFEIAIATAISMYGVGSIAALGTTMGLFWEVPIMLGIVYLARYLHKKKFWQGEPM